jgi:hypothetical protein
MSYNQKDSRISELEARILILEHNTPTNPIKLDLGKLVKDKLRTKKEAAEYALEQHNIEFYKLDKEVQVNPWTTIGGPNWEIDKQRERALEACTLTHEARGNSLEHAVNIYSFSDDENTCDPGLANALTELRIHVANELTNEIMEEGVAPRSARVIIAGAMVNALNAPPRVSAPSALGKQLISLYKFDKQIQQMDQYSQRHNLQRWHDLTLELVRREDANPNNTFSRLDELQNLATKLEQTQGSILTKLVLFTFDIIKAALVVLIWPVQFLSALCALDESLMKPLCWNYFTKNPSSFGRTTPEGKLYAEIKKDRTCANNTMLIRSIAQRDKDRCLNPSAPPLYAA